MIKRFPALKDSTITNAYKANLSTRATGSNMGESDVLEIFSIYGQATTSSIELSRVLVKFPVLTDISSSRANKEIPVSGSAKFYFKLFNAEHGETLPKKYYITLNSITRDWDEGYGLDMVNYSNSGTVNWISASTSAGWTTSGGDYSYITTSYINLGTEDLEVDVTDYIESAINSNTDNGFLVKLSGSMESDTRSYYTKKFFARGSEFFFLRPTLEVRWNDSKKDRRGNFILSSSLLSAADNLNDLYLYNIQDSQYKDLAILGANQTTSTKIYVKLYSTLSGSSAIPLPIGGGVVTNNDTTITGSWVGKGIYKVSTAYSASNTTTVYDVWQTLSGVQLHSGSAITVNTYTIADNESNSLYNLSMPGLKSSYANKKNRFKLFLRNRNQNPNAFTVSTTTPSPNYLDNIFYKLTRASDNYDVIPFGTSSTTSHTKISYDKNGHYFDLDLSMLEQGYMYQLKYCLYSDSYFEELPSKFNFRVE